MTEPSLVPAEEDEYGRSGQCRAQHGPVDPGALLARLAAAVPQQHQPGDGQQHAHVVDPARIWVPGLRNQPGDRRDADRGNRYVDQEDRSPPEMGEQQAAHDRAEGTPDAHRHGPYPDGTGTLLRLAHVTDDRDRLAHHPAGPQPPGRPADYALSRT